MNKVRYLLGEEPRGEAASSEHEICSHLAKCIQLCRSSAKYITKCSKHKHVAGVESPRLASLRCDILPFCP